MKKIVTLAAAAVVLIATLTSAQDAPQGAPDLEKAPWLKGVEISPYPVDISPVIPLKIYSPDGEPLPATMTEDVPFMVVADSAIFDVAPPSEYKGQEIPNPRWVEKPAISWFVIDWEKNVNSHAETQEILPLNQMVIVPTTPTGRAAITCHIGRRMRYDLPEPGRTKETFANSSGAKDVRVLDITPPECGLEISVKDGDSGAFWPVENPPNKYPLPKLADVYLSGALFGAADKDILLQGLELGDNMVVAPEMGKVSLKANDVITLRVIGSDNYKLDNAKIKFGISNGAGGQPNPVGPVGESVIELEKLNLPEDPYLYIDATDTSGNRQVLFVPINIK